MNIYKNFGAGESVTDGEQEYITCHHVFYIITINGAERAIYTNTIICQSTSTGRYRFLPECNLRHVRR